MGSRLGAGSAVGETPPSSLAYVWESLVRYRVVTTNSAFHPLQHGISAGKNVHIGGFPCVNRLGDGHQYVEILSRSKGIVRAPGQLGEPSDRAPPRRRPECTNDFVMRVVEVSAHLKGQSSTGVEQVDPIGEPVPMAGHPLESSVGHDHINGTDRIPRGDIGELESHTVAGVSTGRRDHGAVIVDADHLCFRPARSERGGQSGSTTESSFVDVLDDDELAAWLPGPGAGRRTLLAEVLSRYAGTGRRYHSTVHVRTVVTRVVLLLSELGAAVDDPHTVVWAALWHDAIYDPRSSTNEADSAALARSSLGALGVEPLRLDEVERLILLTARHRVEDDDAAGAVLVDADLAVLGADPDAYAAYVEGVRGEYGFVTDAAWRTGRALVLRRILELPHIFTTERMRAYESAARRNLTSEIDALAVTQPTAQSLRRAQADD